MPSTIAARKAASAAAPRSPAAGEDELRQAVFALFAESQHHISSHRKNVHALRNLHLDVCGAGGDAGREELFFMTFLQCLNTILGVRRNEEAVGRMMRFVVGFVVLSAEKDEAAAAGGSSVTARFIENLMLYALEGIDAREKTVRARLCQVIVACVNSVDELSDHVWEAFRGKMIERLFDKEAAVRVHAVHAMARLQSLPIGEAGGLEVLDIFMDLVQHDPAAEVRRTVLQQIDVNEKSLPTILARKRDHDPRIRRAFYATKLAELDIRTLTIQQRDAVLRAGLTDRDEAVKQACIDMIFSSWIHDTNSNLIEFLHCLDVMGNTAMAESALECFLGMNPGLFDNFSAPYLENLTVETAFILRVSCQHTLRQPGGGPAAVQELLPELTQMAAYIRRAYEALLACEPEDVATRAEIEFVLHELLLVCAHLDYSDEVGRLVLADGLLELLTNLELGDALFTQALLLTIRQAPARADFFETAAGLMADFKDVYTCDGSQAPPDADGLQRSLEALSLGDALPEDVRILAHLRCLEITQQLFSYAHLRLEEEPLLAEALTEIVIPAVNSPFAVIQAAGLLCLALGCGLCRDLAVEYMPLFLDFARLGHDETALVALQTAFDLVFLFGLPPFDAARPADALAASLYDPRGPVQGVAAEGFAKLLLHGILPPPRTRAVLEGLLHLYYHPATEREPGLRQCLAYFFPAFCFSRRANQLALAAVAARFLRGWDALGCTAIGFLEAASQLAHLTDAANLADPAGAPDPGAAGPHDVLAVDALWTMLEEPALAKPFLGLLSRLGLVGMAKVTVKKVIFLLTQLSKLIPADKPTLTTLKKVLAALVELDDLEATIPPEEVAAMKARLQRYIAGADPGAGPARRPPAGKRAAASPADHEVANVLDDLEDILT